MAAPDWILPLIARQAAAQMSKKYPGLSPQEVAERMRAELGHPPSEDEVRFIEAIVARLPRAGAARVDSPASAWVLILANLVPLAGVLWWGWDAFALIALYWMENMVVGVFFMLRMLALDPRDTALWLGKLLAVPFFCFHYGMFTAVHGMFVLNMLGGRRYDLHGFDVLTPAARAAADYGLWPMLGVLTASHLFSFAWNYLYRGEFQRTTLAELTTRPYGRVIALHVAILVGGFGTMLLGSPLWALLVLIAMKIGLDLKAHLKEHSAPNA